MKIGLFLFYAAVVFLPQNASAQTINCNVDKQTIIRMKAPFTGNSGLWSTNFGGDDKHEHFVSGVALSDWEVLTAGEVRAKDKDDNIDSTESNNAEIDTATVSLPPHISLILSKFNHRGRIIWTKTHSIKNLRDIVKVLPFNDGYIVVANIGAATTLKHKPAHIWLGHFDKDGALIAHKTITELRAHIAATDIAVYTLAGKNNNRKIAFTMAATYQNIDNDFAPHARLYMINDDLRVQSHRAFVTGTQNRIETVHLDTKNNVVLAAGYSMGGDGRRNGWLLNLDAGGNIRWQRQYPRGAGATINTIAPYYGATLIAAGYSKPNGGDNNAGWAMRVDGASGTPQWQRFFAGEMNYTIKDMRVNDGGVISMVMNASAGKNAPQTDFVRLLNLSAGGLLIREDSYFNGEGARTAQLLSGPRAEHILIGDSSVSYLKDNTDPNAPADQEKIADQSNQGWIIVGRKPQNYNDPCLQIQKQKGIQ